MPGSQLNEEVTELLQRTDSLLRSSIADRALSEYGRKSMSVRHSFQAANSSGGAARTSITRSSTDADGADALSEAASRLRSSFDAASRKLEALKEAPSLTVPPAIDTLRRHRDGPGSTQAPRLSESQPSNRPEPSISFTEPKTSSTDQGSSWLLTTSLTGGSAGEDRPYNSFAGLQDMVSMVDEIVGAPPSPRQSQAVGASSGAKGGGPLRPRVLGGTRGSAVGGKLFGSSLRSPSRMSSPAPSPRAPLPKPSGFVAAPSTSVGAPSVGSRRAQLQTLLSNDLAQPYDVVKFKNDAKNYGQPPLEVETLAGSLQEKFDRVQRKLKNWELVETSATERFNKALDAALDALFSRVHLTWPSEGVSNGESGPRTCTSTRASSRSRISSKGHSQDREQQRAPEKLSGSVDRCLGHQGSGQRADDCDDSASESPSSSASRRDAWEDLLDSTSEAAARLLAGSDNFASGGDLLHGASKFGRAHGRDKEKGSGRGLAGQRSGRRHQDVPIGTAHQMRATGNTLSNDAAEARADKVSCGQYIYAGPGIPAAAQFPSAAAMAGVNKAMAYMVPGAPYTNASQPPAAMLASMNARAATAPMHGLFTAPPALFPAATASSNSTAISAPAAANAAAPFQYVPGPIGASPIVPAIQAARLPTSAGGQRAGDTCWKPGTSMGGGLRLVSSGPWTQSEPLTAAAQHLFPSNLRLPYDDSTLRYGHDQVYGGCTVPQIAPSNSASHAVNSSGALPTTSASAISAPIQAVWSSMPTNSSLAATSNSPEGAGGRGSSAIMQGYSNPGPIFSLPATLAGYATGAQGAFLNYFGKAEMVGGGQYPNI